MFSQCTALNVSDEKRCEAAATSLNGFFCSYHSKQCQGLYNGYKRRNAQLDSVTSSPPSYLANHHIPLANQLFQDVNDEQTLKKVHGHLFLRYNLLDRVIRARKLHHSRFFSLNLDYGHQHYLDQLQSQKAIVLKALERLDRRTTEVIYSQRKWYDWVREQQDDEEAQRENEKKRLKKEAALFQRHSKEVAARIQHMRAREEERRQEECLKKAYQDRISENELEELDEDQWDPIEDVIEGERGSYIELIKRFLWMDSGGAPPASDADRSKIDTTATLPLQSVTSGMEDHRSNGALEGPAHDSKSKKKKKKPQTQVTARTPDKDLIESKPDMHRRLAHGMQYQSRPNGWYMVGSLENPVQLVEKSASLPPDEIDTLLGDVTEIKHLLFCRLILSHATLLPIALQCQTVQEFLDHDCVSHTELRDLCLKMEQPALEAVRDACADLVRDAAGEDGEDMIVERDPGEGDTPHRQSDSKQLEEYSKRIGDRFAQRAQILEDGESAGAFVNFGKIDDRSQYQIKREQVRVCGRFIYNYPSEKAMTRGGWLQFSIIAKDCNLFDAMHLCRSWDEFFELNILTVFHYFPASNWMEWIGDRFRQQMLQLGFIIYFQFDQAPEATQHHQTGSRSQLRKAHQFVEVRNFICAHIKRNDPCSRRLIRYLSMASHELLVLVRDAKTDEILVKPRSDQLWLARAKKGVGRASKNNWEIVEEVGPRFFQKMETLRKWRFGFKEYYDVYIWDLKPGEGFGGLYNSVQALCMKAQRCRSGRDRYNAAGRILKTLTRDRDTGRARDVKPDEIARSIWDDLCHEESYMLHKSINTRTGEVRDEKEGAVEKFLYSHGDFLEDQILFPEETEDQESNPGMSNIGDAMARLEVPRSINPRFILGLDVDEPLHLVESAEESDQQSPASSDDEHHPEQISLSDANSGKDKTLWKTLFDKTVPPKTHLDFADFSDYLKKGVNSESLDFFPSISERRDAMEILEGWALGYPDLAEPKEALMQYLDREKAFYFKRSWHAADLEPNAQAHYCQANEMIEAAEHVNDQASEDKMHFCGQVLVWLSYDPTEHPRVLEDVYRAYAMMRPFFPQLSSPFFSSEIGSRFKDSLLVRQKDRAADIPRLRSYTSNKFRSEEFWKEWSNIYKNNTYCEDDFPEEWNHAIRPKIAKLYREGVIENCPQPRTPGHAIAARDPHLRADNELDLFLDFRIVMQSTPFPTALTNPYELPPLLTSAERYAATRPGACFALLRLWSASHFYPLMIGYDSRSDLAFTDGLGRSWQWKFVPKDMPYSELSMHRQLKLRLEPYVDESIEGVLAGNVVFKRNAILVMGENEKELLRCAAATAFVLQTRPWRLEVDLWKSYINVDLEFLQDLHGHWLE